MPNSLIDAYRSALAAQGQTDGRDDYFVMRDTLVPMATSNPALLQQFPDFAKEFGQIREENALSLVGEAVQGAERGTEGAAATYAGLGALATGSDALKADASALNQDAAGHPATVSTLSDIAPGETGLDRVFSKDTIRYLAGKAGEFVPNMAEMAGLSLAGGAVGSAIEPGVGTVAGAAEGAVEGALGRGVIKSAIKHIVEETTEEGATAEEKAAAEEAIKNSIRAGDQKTADTVSKVAKSLSGSTASRATNFANITAQSAGGIYNDTGRRDLALGLGAAAGALAEIPVSLPARVARSMFPGMAEDEAQAAAEDEVRSKARELISKVGVAAEGTASGTVGMVGMEAANIVAKNLSQGKGALDLDPDDWKRLREAAVGGALASAPFGVLAARGGGEDETSTVKTPPSTRDLNPGETGATLPADEEDEETPATPTGSPTSQAIRRLVGMSDEDKADRLEELQAAASRTPTEDAEMQILQATAKRAAGTPKTPPSTRDLNSGDTGSTLPPGGTIGFADAGFDSQDAFDKAYAEGHSAEVFETTDEYLKRIYCSNAA